jgi:hypothetical protein
MSFDYRELAGQVPLYAGDEAGCKHRTCRQHTQDVPCEVCSTTKPDECGEKTCRHGTVEDDDCEPCSTTKGPCDTNTCTEGSEDDYRKALGLLRQQLRDTLAAG